MPTCANQRHKSCGPISGPTALSTRPACTMTEVRVLHSIIPIRSIAKKKAGSSPAFLFELHCGTQKPSGVRRWCCPSIGACGKRGVTIYDKSPMPLSKQPTTHIISVIEASYGRPERSGGDTSNGSGRVGDVGGRGRSDHQTVIPDIHMAALHGDRRNISGLIHSWRIHIPRYLIILHLRRVHCR